MSIWPIRLRHLVQHGRLDRLSPPSDDTPSVVQYTAPDTSETLLLAWRRTSRHGSPQPPVRLRGLTPEARYRDARTGAVHQAAVLTGYGMHLGLPPGDWSSAAVHLIRETEA
ncbi:GH36 C-terminal domain-containing protein [Streptomyces sp. NBC_00118]|uniref:GH36 C-terminal domain-containing protein n=1 Tax=unclassified Streptomyces TaxID=2593676 RepID=UPI00324D280D